MNRELLALAALVVPHQRVAADHVDELPLLRRAVAHHQHLSGAELRELSRLRLPAGEVDHRNLFDRERPVFIAGRDVEVAVDQVFVLIAVEGDGAAGPFAVGENEIDPLWGGERVGAGAGDERGRSENSTNHVTLL